jgi:hypothetical protein
MERKRARADLVVDNSGDTAKIAAQVEAGLRRLGFGGHPT